MSQSAEAADWAQGWSRRAFWFGRLRIEVSAWFAVALAVLVVFGWMAGGILAETVDAPPAPVFAVVVPVVCIGLALIHEAGHVVAGTLTAHPFQWRLRLHAAGVAVFLEGTPTRWRRVAISAGGPIAHAAASGFVLLAVGSGWVALTTPVGLAAGFSLFDALVNLLIPLGRRTDAAKLYLGIGQIIRGRV